MYESNAEGIVTMILDHLNTAERYFGLHPGFAQGFSFLRRPGLAELADGRYEIDGDLVYAIIARADGRGREQAKLECHRRYIDIQYAVCGTDVIGWGPLHACSQTDAPYASNTDCILYLDPPQAWADLAPETFMVFFPEDAHAPLAGTGPLHKVVVKVAV